MLCRAKINLTLHVGAPMANGRWKGYHPVESLVVFADVGDRIEFSASEQTKLKIDGPFGAGLTAGHDNLILTALTLCNASPVAVRLTKNLPVSSGLGGGSANAAAVLRAFDKKHHVDAASIGADVPVCCLSETSMMTGIGEIVTPVPGLGQMAAVLVNPGIAVSTGDIFRIYDGLNPKSQPDETATFGGLLDRTLSGRNDLQKTAVTLVPEIASVLAALETSEGCSVARMSGSGATCFGLFETDEAARSVAERLSQRGWWAVATRLGESAP